MIVEVKVYGHLRQKFPESKNGVMTLEIPKNSSVENLLTILNINLNNFFILIVNDKKALPSTKLHENYKVKIMPINAGG